MPSRDTLGPFPAGSFKIMNGSSGVRGLPGAYPSAFCQKISIRSKSLTSITMDPIRTVAFPMPRRTQESGYEFCDVAGGERAADDLFQMRGEPSQVSVKPGDAVFRLSRSG